MDYSEIEEMVRDKSEGKGLRDIVDAPKEGGGLNEEDYSPGEIIRDGDTYIVRKGGEGALPDGFEQSGESDNWLYYKIREGAEAPSTKFLQEHDRTAIIKDASQKIFDIISRAKEGSTEEGDIKVVKEGEDLSGREEYQKIFTWNGQDYYQDTGTKEDYSYLGPVGMVAGAILGGVVGTIAGGPGAGTVAGAAAGAQLGSGIGKGAAASAAGEGWQPAVTEAAWGVAKTGAALTGPIAPLATGAVETAYAKTKGEDWAAAIESGVRAGIVTKAMAMGPEFGALATTLDVKTRGGGDWSSALLAGVTSEVSTRGVGYVTGGEQPGAFGTYQGASWGEFGQTQLGDIASGQGTFADVFPWHKNLFKQVGETAAEKTPFVYSPTTKATSATELKLNPATQTATTILTGQEAPSILNISAPRTEANIAAVTATVPTPPLAPSRAGNIPLSQQENIAGMNAFSAGITTPTPTPLETAGKIEMMPTDQLFKFGTNPTDIRAGLTSARASGKLTEAQFNAGWATTEKYFPGSNVPQAPGMFSGKWGMSEYIIGGTALTGLLGAGAGIYSIYSQQKAAEEQQKNWQNQFDYQKQVDERNYQLALWKAQQDAQLSWASLAQRQTETTGKNIIPGGFRM